MKKWFIPLISLTLALAITGSVAGFALTNGESGAADQDPTGEITHGDPTYDEWLSDFGDGKVLTSADDIDPELILEPSSPMKPICADFGCGIGDGKVVTSANDIDPELILVR